MIDIVICLITNFFRIYLIRKFIYLFVKEIKTEKIKETIAYSTYFIINTILYLVFHFVWINFLSNIIGISLVVFLYTKSIKTNIFITGSIYLINMVCDTITVMLFVNYEDGQGYNQIYSVITVLLIFACELLTEKILNDRKCGEVIQSPPLVIIPFCSISIILFMIYRKNRPDIELLVVCLGLVIMNFLILHLYNLLLNAFIQKYENEMLQQKVQIYKNQIDVILENEDAVKTLRHDMKHHLNELKLLATNKKMNAIQYYINNMVDYIDNTNEIVSSGNLEIDSILNYMIQIGKKELCTVKVSVQIPEAISHSFDIIIIIGNLLENAIEAARNTEEKMLNIKIQFKKGVLKIEIENSFKNEILAQKNKLNSVKLFKTTKNDNKMHGIGLNSVKKIVEKYNGVMKIQLEEKRFYTKLILYIDTI